MLLGLGLYLNRFLRVLNWQVLAPLSRLKFIIGAWIVLEWISERSDFAGACSAVEVSFHYQGWACVRMDFKKIRICGCWLRCRGWPILLGLGLYWNGFLKVLNLLGGGSAVEVGSYSWGVACIRMDF